MGVVIAAQLAIGLALGLLVDHIAATAPLFLFVGLALGIIAAVVYVVLRFREFLSRSSDGPSE